MNTFIKNWLTGIGIFGILSVALSFYIVGCQDVLISPLPKYDCEDEINVEGVSCGDPETEIAIYDTEEQVVHPQSPEAPLPVQASPKTIINTILGRINIVFVMDDSGSMSEEQDSIATQFNSFLEDIRLTDYRIAITTTDINADGGRFLMFPDGHYFLENPEKSNSVHSRNVHYFQKTIKRPIGTNVDERGIYALNKVLDHGYSEFFRPHSLFMVVIVSDEDERSNGGKSGEKPLEAYDLPDTFFRKVSHHNKFSVVSVHSIIVKPGDQACAEDAGGFEGNVYARASRPSSAIRSKYGNILTGHVGSICSTNYSSQLGPIADTLVSVPPFPLPCFPELNSIRLEIDGSPVNISVNGRQIIINEAVSFGSKARIEFRCKKGNL